MAGRMRRRRGPTRFKRRCGRRTERAARTKRRLRRFGHLIDHVRKRWTVSVQPGRQNRERAPLSTPRTENQARPCAQRRLKQRARARSSNARASRRPRREMRRRLTTMTTMTIRTTTTICRYHSCGCGTSCCNHRVVRNGRSEKPGLRLLRVRPQPRRERGGLQRQRGQ